MSYLAWLVNFARVHLPVLISSDQLSMIASYNMVKLYFKFNQVDSHWVMLLIFYLIGLTFGWTSRNLFENIFLIIPSLVSHQFLFVYQTTLKLIFEAHVDSHMESWKMGENEFSGLYFRDFLTVVLWPPHVKSWLIGKDSDAGRDWGQEEKGMTQDEMAGWHHRLDGCEFESTSILRW